MCLFACLQGKQMVQGLRLVVDTYIMFDKDGSGTIER